MDNKFIDIAVVATMSAGKSTLVNSLLGTELMHSANEATTAKITVLEQDNQLDKYVGSAKTGSGITMRPYSPITAEILREWNRENRIAEVSLRGPFENVAPLAKPIRIYDTPGPNNSRDETHGQILEGFLSKNKLDVVLYVLNATQIGINDDQALLKLLISKAEKNIGNIIFIINKIDALDEERGETMLSVTEKVTQYLENNGVNKNFLKNIVCMSAETVLVASKYMSNQELTRSEKHALMKLVNAARGKKDFLTYQELDKFEYQNKIDIFNGLIKDSGILNLNLMLVDLLKGEKKMINLYIEHNPFTIETKILVNGEAPADNSGLSSFMNQRLQFWVDDLFVELYRICGEERNYCLEFKGVGTDCRDIEEAVKNAREQNFNIELNCISVEDGNQRLTKITELIEEAKANPLFAEYFEQNRDVQKNLESAMDKDFDAFVVATMSSGKSTFINGMLGCELLPALNEATTATIARIYNDKTKEQGEFVLNQISKDRKLLNENYKLHIKNKETNAEANILSTWNKDPNTYCINIDGNILGIDANKNVRLVLTDTPGPNNSQDEEHSKTTMSYIKDSDRSPMILYVLNATQLGINDDKGLLTEISQIMREGGKQSRDRFLFILNKADVFDPEKGENVGSVVENAKQYLRDNGIDNPRVYPVSSQLALLFRKRALSPDLLTRSERGALTTFEELFIEEDSMDLVQYMPLNATERQILEDKGYPECLKRSGVPAVEVAISEYIKKYNLPHRVSRAYQVLREIILRSSNKAEIENALNVNEIELAQIKETIDLLNEKKSSAFASKGFIDSLGEEASLSDDLVDYIQGRQRDAIIELKEIGNGLRDSNVDPHIAERELDFLLNSVKQKIDSMLIDLEKAIDSSQDEVRENLLESYHQYISNLFDNVADETGLNLPLFENLRKQVSSFGEKAFAIRASDIETVSKSVVVGTRTVKDSKWYNPFSWGRTREVNIYETVNYEKVNLLKVWDERFVEITKYVNSTAMQCSRISEEQAKETLNHFIAFINKEFDKGFNYIMDSLSEKIADKDEREAVVAQAQQDLKAINAFECKLNKILSMEV